MVRTIDAAADDDRHSSVRQQFALEKNSIDLLPVDKDVVRPFDRERLRRPGEYRLHRVVDGDRRHEGQGANLRFRRGIDHQKGGVKVAFLRYPGPPTAAPSLNLPFRGDPQISRIASPGAFEGETVGRADISERDAAMVRQPGNGKRLHDGVRRRSWPQLAPSCRSVRRSAHKRGRKRRRGRAPPGALWPLAGKLQQAHRTT